MAKIKITQVRSIIGSPECQRRVMRSLGIRKMNHSVVREDTPSILGQVRKVSHLVKVEQVNE